MQNYISKKDISLVATTKQRTIITQQLPPMSCFRLYAYGACGEKAFQL